jgi:hypothetical protein
MTARYLAIATGLGFAWYVVLQIPSTTRSFMAGIGQITAALRRFIANSDNVPRLTVAGPFWSLLVAVWCSLLVLPMGYVAQRAMRWASGEDDHRQVD